MSYFCDDCDSGFLVEELEIPSIKEKLLCPKCGHVLIYVGELDEEDLTSGLEDEEETEEDLDDDDEEDGT